MDKRYQIFVSSTFADLREERQQVIQTLMEMDCIPSGMELFPAMDEEQWEFIKRIIDDCDYYLLIIGGRYGSTTSEGISYTEKEYDYAMEKGIRVIALLHSEPEKISVEKSEVDPELRAKLETFRSKVSESRLVRFWKTAEELPGLVALSLTKTIKTYPAVGWVRADQTSSPDLLSDINELRKENEKLKEQLKAYEQTKEVKLENLASIDEKVEVKGTYQVHLRDSAKGWTRETTWREIFSLLSPCLLEKLHDGQVKTTLKSALFNRSGFSPTLDSQSFQTIKVQLIALGLVKVESIKTVKGGMGLFWSLTDKGYRFMMELRSVKQKAKV